MCPHPGIKLNDANAIILIALQDRAYCFGIIRVDLGANLNRLRFGWAFAADCAVPS